MTPKAFFFLYSKSEISLYGGISIYATGRLHLNLKVGFIHWVVFHLQSMASMSPLVSQLISMAAPEIRSHTLVSRSGLLCCLPPVPPLSFLSYSIKAKTKPWTTTFHLYWLCQTHLRHRSGCKGWSTSGYTAAGRTSQSRRDAL